jgi:hypothetical protein
MLFIQKLFIELISIKIVAFFNAKNRSNRVRHYGYKISRYSADIARYKMLKHKGDTPNPDRYEIYSIHTLHSSYSERRGAQKQFTITGYSL